MAVGGSRLAFGMARMSPVVFLVFVLVAASLASGCHGSGATAPIDAASSPDAIFAGCAGTDAAAYTPGKTTASKSGAWVATLTSITTTSAGGPPVDAPAVGIATFAVTIASAGGVPPTGMTMTAEKPYMPAHRHYAAVSPVVTDGGGGTFEVSNVSFFMPGEFQIPLDLQFAGSGDGDAGGGDDAAVAAPGTTDQIILDLCVPA